VLCRLSIVDRQRNNVSLIEVLEQITFEGKDDPGAGMLGLAFPLEIVSFWQRSAPDEGELFRVRLLIVSPAGEPLNMDDDQLQYDVDLTQYQRFRMIATIPGLPFVGNGLYRFIVQIYDESSEQWEDVASLPLEVVMKITPE
jgi:hypothetical protein